MADAGGRCDGGCLAGAGGNGWEGAAVIYTTMKAKGILRNRIVMEGERAEMPWLRHFMERAAAGEVIGQRVGSMNLFHSMNWEPEAAEKVLAYIATGSWSGKPEGAKTGLLGPDGVPI